MMCYYLNVHFQDQRVNQSCCKNLKANILRSVFSFFKFLIMNALTKLRYKKAEQFRLDTAGGFAFICLEKLCQLQCLFRCYSLHSIFSVELL